MANSNPTDKGDSEVIGVRDTTRGDDSTYRVRDGESVTEAVVRAMGSERQTDPTGLQPLYSVIDTDALNKLFAARNGGERQGDGSVAFDYSGHRVRVEADGTVQIRA